MTAIKQASEKEQHEQVREMIAQAHSASQLGTRIIQ
jgi:epoxyqueuosine reductase